MQGNSHDDLKKNLNLRCTSCQETILIVHTWLNGVVQSGMSGDGLSVALEVIEAVVVTTSLATKVTEKEE